MRTNTQTMSTEESWATKLREDTTFRLKDEVEFSVLANDLGIPGNHSLERLLQMCGSFGEFFKQVLAGKLGANGSAFPRHDWHKLYREGIKVLSQEDIQYQRMHAPRSYNPLKGQNLYEEESHSHPGPAGHHPSYQGHTGTQQHAVNAPNGQQQSQFQQQSQDPNQAPSTPNRDGHLVETDRLAAKASDLQAELNASADRFNAVTKDLRETVVSLAKKQQGKNSTKAEVQALVEVIRNRQAFSKTLEDSIKAKQIHLTETTERQNELFKEHEANMSERRLKVANRIKLDILFNGSKTDMIAAAIATATAANIALEAASSAVLAYPGPFGGEEYPELLGQGGRAVQVIDVVAEETAAFAFENAAKNTR